VLSTRLRLARNLASFPFPACERDDDGERVLSLIFDAFAHLDNSSQYQANRLESLPPLRRKLVTDRGLIKPPPPVKENTPAPVEPLQGIVTRNDGKVVATVNDTDHLRISAYSSGLNTDEVWDLCHSLDEDLQKTLQFAASYETGFLTSSLFDAGSGMKLSIHAHLPAIELAESHAHSEVINGIVGRGFVAETYYGINQATGLPFGSYYRIRNANASGGTEFDQIAALQACARFLVTAERKFRAMIADKKPTVLRDRVYRAFAAIKYSRFMEEREAIGWLSDIKLGIDTGIITGVDYPTLTALFYRIKSAHLEMIIHSGHFSFESDVAASERLQVLRMRALIVQEALEDVLLQAV
jgi:protein arginine kinase